jgi:glutathione S-transferase
MILFFAPGASSQAVHIMLRVAGLPFDLEKVDLVRQAWAGGDYTRINPKSCVPALRLNDGTVLTECTTILMYIADQVPALRLAPAGTLLRYRTLEWLSYIASDIHKNFIAPERHSGRGANFLPQTDAGRRIAIARVSPRLGYVDQQLEGREYLLGNALSVPDAYLFTMLTWANRLGMDLAMWQNLRAFQARMATLAPVRIALDTEGPAHSLQG